MAVVVQSQLERVELPWRQWRAAVAVARLHGWHYRCDPPVAIGSRDASEFADALERGLGDIPQHDALGLRDLVIATPRGGIEVRGAGRQVAADERCLGGTLGQATRRPRSPG